MSVVNAISFTAIASGIFAFYSRRSLRYLQFFQQEEYNTQRFFNWWQEKKAFDTRGSLVAIVAAATTFGAAKLNPWLGAIVAILGSIVLTAIAYSEEDPRKVGKITLKMTERATRIYQLALALYAIKCISVGLALYFRNIAPVWEWLAAIFLIQSTPVWPILANAILWPQEESRQQQYLQEAYQIFQDEDPVTIGITGSYGKTSTKAILGQILECIEPTFWPPGSINTPMGITRYIRENYKPQQRVAIIEMAAYNIGSIARLCKLTPPDVGIVTAVGVMHLDRFGGADNIYIAKSELPQAIPASGTLVCNGDNPGARRMVAENPKKVNLLYGLHPETGHLDCSMTDIQSTAEGTYFNINWQGQAYTGFTKLLGEPMLSNITGAFTMACALGYNPTYVIAAIYTLQPEKNRLALRKNGDCFILDDSYNSNPIGFASALDVLKEIPSGRKILMTPGMVELGEIQDVENAKIATKAAGICDLVAVVGETNRSAILQGLKEGGMGDDRILLFDNRDAALTKLNSPDFRQAKDLVLIENDLPDLYEAEVKF